MTSELPHMHAKLPRLTSDSCDGLIAITIAKFRLRFNIVSEVLTLEDRSSFQHFGLVPDVTTLPTISDPHIGRTPTFRQVTSTRIFSSSPTAPSTLEALRM